MSWGVFFKQALGSSPGAGKVLVGVDTDKRMKLLDGDDGQTYVLGDSNWPKNHLINSGFNFAQRQVPGTLTSYASSTSRRYGADRWFMSIETTSLQYQQIDSIAAPETGLQHRYYGKFKQITGAGKSVIGQILTAENMSVLRGKTVRVQFKMKRSVAAAMTVRLGLVQLQAAGTHDTVPGYVNGAPSGTFITAFGANSTDPTLGTNLAYIAPVANTGDGGTISGNGLTCVLSGAWVRYSAAFTVPLDAKNLMVMLWTDSQLAINDELNMTECGLFNGPDIVDWLSMPQVYELDRCSRFYEKSFPLATVPAQNAGLTSAWRGNAAQAGAVAFVHGFIVFSVPKRAIPAAAAIVVFNPAAANAFLRYIITPSDATATSVTQPSEHGFEVTATGLAAWVAGGGIALHWTCDVEL